MRKRIATGFVLSGVALVTALGAPALAAGSGSAGPTKVTVKPAQVFTSSGIILKAGETVTITSSGRIHFGGGRISSLTPAGIPRGADCEAISINQPRSTPWPAPSLSCWSLIGKVQGGEILEIGLQRTFQPQVTGELLLGVNDNYVSDNSGSWAATVAITPAGVKPTTASTAPTTTAVPAGTATGKKSKSNTTLFLAIGAGLAVLLLFVLWRFAGSRRRTDKKRADPEVIPAPIVAAIPGAPSPYASMVATKSEPETEPQPDPAAVAGAATAPLAPATPIAPPETDSIDVNIFEVEFSNGLTLRVGYNHFPEGTTLRWKVTQSRIPVSSGHFIAKGGGSTNHVETVPLGTKLEGRDAQPDGADVQFDWSVNGVPFRYSVRRDPNC